MLLADGWFAAAYLTSCADRALTDSETTALREAVEAVISSHGAFHVTKDTVLITARK